MDSINKSDYFGDWLVENGRNILGGILAIIIICALLWYYFGKRMNENDYINATNQFILFKREVVTSKGDNAAALAALAKLEESMKLAPELHTKYDGEIAQLLLAMGENHQALDYSKRFLKLSYPKALQTYATFASQSVDVVEGNLQNALALAKTINEKANSSSLLSAYNLLQTALLEQAVGDSKSAKASWEEIKASLNNGTVQTIAKLFSLGNINLTQFIEQQNKDG